MQIIGNLGYDAVIRTTDNRSVISFSLAHSEKYTDKNGVKTEKTIWVNCSFWKDDDKVILAQYLRKGCKVWVSGTPETTCYQTKEGNWKSELKITVFRLELLGDSKKSDDNENV